jgi:hypothetical protein
VILVLGRLAAVGETHHEEVKSGYLLAEDLETIKDEAELDSLKMRRVYREAKRAH